jgi:hypothetical protein
MTLKEAIERYVESGRDEMWLGAIEAICHLHEIRRREYADSIPDCERMGDIVAKFGPRLY